MYTPMHGRLEFAVCTSATELNGTRDQSSRVPDYVRQIRGSI